MNYEETANRLIERIEALVPSHPEILRLESPWDLFRIEGFECADLQPSLAQASWALTQVRSRAAQRTGAAP